MFIGHPTVINRINYYRKNKMCENKTVLGKYVQTFFVWISSIVGLYLGDCI